MTASVGRVRVFLPSTLPRLARAVAEGKLEPAGGTGYAVTPALLDLHGADGDPEELEFLAAESAAAAALRLLAADLRTRPDLGTDPDLHRLARRLVVGVDTDDTDTDADAAETGAADREPDLVRLHGSVPLSAVAALLVDPASMAAVVAAALPAAGSEADDSDGSHGSSVGVDRSARAARAEVEASPLLWFDRSEIDVLTEGVDAS